MTLLLAFGTPFGGGAGGAHQARRRWLAAVYWAGPPRPALASRGFAGVDRRPRRAQCSWSSPRRRRSTSCGFTWLQPGGRRAQHLAVCRRAPSLWARTSSSRRCVVAWRLAPTRWGWAAAVASRRPRQAATARLPADRRCWRRSAGPRGRPSPTRGVRVRRAADGLAAWLLVGRHRLGGDRLHRLGALAVHAAEGGLRPRPAARGGAPRDRGPEPVRPGDAGRDLARRHLALLLVPAARRAGDDAGRLAARRRRAGAVGPGRHPRAGRRGVAAGAGARGGPRRPGADALKAVAIAALVLPFSVAVLFGNLDAWYGARVRRTRAGRRRGAVHTRRGRSRAAIALGIVSVAKLHPASLLVWLLARAIVDRRGPARAGAGGGRRHRARRGRRQPARGRHRAVAGLRRRGARGDRRGGRGPAQCGAGVAAGAGGRARRRPASGWRRRWSRWRPSR